MSLKDKVDTLRLQLGLGPEMPIVDVVDHAVSQLGLESEARGMTIIQKAETCLSQLGGSAASMLPVAFASEVPSVAVMQPVQSTWVQPMAVPISNTNAFSSSSPKAPSAAAIGSPLIR